MPIQGYGVDVAADGTNTPYGAYRMPAVRPVVVAVYIPPKSAPPGIVSLSRGRSSNASTTLATLHVSYGPVTLADLAALYLPTQAVPNVPNLTSPVFSVAPLTARGQTVCLLHTLPLTEGSSNGARPHVVDLAGHPGDPEHDGLLVVAQCDADAFLQLSVLPRGRHTARGLPRTRDDAVGLFG